VRDVEYRKIAVIALVALVLTAPLVVVAQTTEPPRDEYPEPLVAVAGVYRLRSLLLDVDKAIELAYTIRNLTYDLFQWEIEYNVTAARIQLERGDGFLNRSLELKDIAPRRAAVFALVATIHYSHAPALANSVLGKVIRANLGENYTVTDKTVQAVINVSQELRGLLLNAIAYAQDKGVNTTLVEALVEHGDERIANATSQLEAGNITDAFMYAVSGYRVYVRAYHLLVRLTILKYLRDVVGEELTKGLLEERVQIAKVAVGNLPVWVREHVRARVERGEIKSIKEIADELTDKAMSIREQARERERVNLETAVRRILDRSGVPSNIITDQEIRQVVYSAWNQGKRGTDLAREVLETVKELVRNRTGRDINIPTPPMRVRGK
jgi:hypothetical protein